MSVLWLPRQTTWVSLPAAALLTLFGLTLHLDRPRPGVCWGGHDYIMSRRAKNMIDSLQSSHLKLGFRCLSNKYIVLSHWQAWCSCSYVTQIHFKNTCMCAQLIMSSETALIMNKGKSLVTFGYRNILTRCFFLRYWWRKISGLNSSIQGTQSMATTMRKHCIPFCKVRDKSLHKAHQSHHFQLQHEFPPKQYFLTGLWILPGSQNNEQVPWQAQ